MLSIRRRRGDEGGVEGCREEGGWNRLERVDVTCFIDCPTRLLRIQHHHETNHNWRKIQIIRHIDMI